MTAVNALAKVLLDCLVWTSLQAVLLAALVALVQVLLPRLRANARCALWWLVGLQVAIGMCWQMPIRVPLASPDSTFPLHVAAPQALLASATATNSAVVNITSPPDSHLALYNCLIALWLLGVLVQVAPVLRERKRLRALLRSARTVADRALQTRCETHARQLGLRRCPRILESRRATTPSVGGFWKPFILLPQDRAWTPTETQYVIAHELAHLKRRDLWLGSIPALAQRLFFFHPVVRLAVREYATYREAACDAQVLRQQGVRAKDYGHLLLRLGVLRGETAGLASASPTFRNLKRRLLLLGQDSASSSRILAGGAWALTLSVALLGVVPYRVVAAPPIERTPRDARSLGSEVTAVPDSSSSSGLTVCCGHSEIYVGPSAKGQALVLFDNGNVLINGGSADIAAAKPFYSSNATLLWFRHGGRTYLVRDAASIRQVRNLYAPVMAIAKQQADLLSKQERLVGKQSLLSEQEIGIANQRAAAAAEQLRAANPASNATSNQRSAAGAAGIDETSAAQPSRPALGRQRLKQARDLDVQESKIEVSREALARKQSDLADQQDALDDRLRTSAESLQQPVGQLLNEMIGSGIAHQSGDR